MSDSFLQNLDPNNLKTRFNISEEELDLLRLFGMEGKKHLDVFIEDMYKWMPSLREFRKFFTNEQLIPHVKAQQKMYWQIFFNSRIDQDYVRNRTNIGFTHARINLPINTYCVGMNFSIEWWLTRLETIVDKEKFDMLSIAQTFRKMCSLDIALITESYSQLMNEKVKTLLDDTNSILDKITNVAESIAIGDFSQGYKMAGEQDKRLSVAVNQMTDNLREVVKQTKMIAQGRYDIEFTPMSEKDELGKAVSEMTKTLREMSIENKKSGWIKTGQAELSNIIRGDQDLRELGKNVISFLAKYLGALVGTIYQVDLMTEKTLELIGSYAYHRRKGDRSKIRFGEGLIGQAALEKEIVIFSNVPEDYTSISSSLGEILPRNIIIVPLQIENEIIGVIELGTHELFDNTKMELLRQVSENIAIAIKSSQNSDKMKRLLDESKRQSEILQTQQEELKCTNEELQAQQERLRESNEELERQTAILKKSEEEIKNKNEELKDKTKYLERQTLDIQEKSQQIEKAKVEVERKAKELEVASKYKTEFLANMSHELRTPLNSLLILSKSLAENDEGNLTAEQTESAQVIYKGGQDLLNLINDILDLSKVEAGKLQIHVNEISVHSILENLRKQFSPIANEKGVEFRTDASGVAHSTLKTDGQRIEQILKNFLSNAFKFTQKGSVTMKVHQPAPGTIFKNNLSPRNCIGFSIVDTGIGISKDKQDLIFEAFHQGDGATNRKFGGTGLGLSISRELAKILGGEIHLFSEIGKGSTFTLYLPLDIHESTPKKKRSDKYEMATSMTFHENDTQTVEHNGDASIVNHVFLKDDRDNISQKDKTLLIIEDDRSFASILMNFARKKDYKCIVAPNGKTGLQLAFEHKPCGITLDLKLPDIEGRNILDQLKANPETRQIPVHVISFDSDEISSIQKGAVGHLTKPVKSEDIETAFANIEKLSQKSVKNILIVEDSKVEQKALKNLFQDYDLITTIVDSGEEALQIIQDKLFDCVILDLQLPGISGVEVLKKLSLNPFIKLPPIIIYTGRDLTKDEFQELHEYTSSFVVKGLGAQDRILDELFIFLHRIKPPINNKSEAATANFSLENCKVLLVDDDMRNTFALSGILKKKGLQIVLADNGQTALDKLENDQDINIVIMDIMMPVMDGYEAIRRIRLQNKFLNLPIIALTAKILPEDKNKAMKVGANDFLTKPVDMEKLLSLMKLWLSHSANLTPSRE